MAGTIIVDRIESDASYASTINVANKITFSNTTTFRSNSTISTTAAESLRLHRSGSSSQISSLVMEDGGSSVGTANTVRLSTSLGALSISTGGTGGSSTGGTEQMSITSTGLLQFNSGYGSVATAYGCRAWVNFNGTSTVAIRGSGNVTSITDNGTGDYTVNFTTAMPDANYAPTFMIRTSATARFETAVIRGDVDPTTASLRFVTGMSTYGVDNYQMDTSIVSVSIFR